MARSLEVSVSSSTCISSGYCRNNLPDVFGSTPERKSTVLVNPVADSPALREALEGCPVEALSAVDADTGETVFP